MQPPPSQKIKTHHHHTRYSSLPPPTQLKFTSTYSQILEKPPPRQKNKFCNHLVGKSIFTTTYFMIHRTSAVIHRFWKNLTTHLNCGCILFILKTKNKFLFFFPLLNLPYFSEVKLIEVPVLYFFAPKSAVSTEHKEVQSLSIYPIFL